jgi:uncharacterized membrane protein YfcA
MEGLYVFLIVFLAIFVQSLTGFGLALVSMPLLTAVLGIRTSAPLVAVFALVAELVLLLYYRHALDLRLVWRLAFASLLGVPLGVMALRVVDERLVLMLLGVLLVAYSIYALLSVRLPSIEQTLWAYGAGFLAGILGGAYNTAGPPVIVYGNCRGWSPEQFKANLQGFFVLNSLAIFAAHILAHNFTRPVWQNSLVSLPAVALGIVTGLSLSHRINAARFRRVVLALLFLMGLWLLFA